MYNYKRRVISHGFKMPFDEEEEFELIPELEFLSEGEVSPVFSKLTSTPRILTYTTKDVIDKRISIPAQHSLVRLSKNPVTSADAVGILEEVKAARLGGIYCVNWEKSAQRALKFGKSWWTVIPPGEDAILMLDPDNPLSGQPLIAFRRELSPDCGLLKDEKRFAGSPAKLDEALLKVWVSYGLWKAGKLSAACSARNFDDRIKTLAEVDSPPILERCMQNVVPPMIASGKPAAIPVVSIGRVLWGEKHFGLFENAAKHKVLDPLTNTPIKKGDVAIELPAENLARGQLIETLPTVRPGKNAATQQAVCCVKGSTIKLIVEILNPSLSQLKGKLIATPELIDKQGTVPLKATPAVLDFDAHEFADQPFLFITISLGKLPKKMGLYLLRVRWKANPPDANKQFRFSSVTTEQHIACIMGDSPLDPTKDKLVAVSHTATGTHERLLKLFSIIPRPTNDADDVTWRIHEAVNNSTPPNFFNLLGVHITHNGDIERHWIGGKLVGTGVRLPLEDQWLMWVRMAGVPPFNRAACTGYVQLVKDMLNLLGIPVQRKLILPVTKQMPPSKPGGTPPPMLSLSDLKLTSDVIVAPGGLDVSASIQKVVLKGLDGKDYEARIALMKDKRRGEFFEACAVTPAGKFLPGGFSTRRVVATAPNFARNRGFNGALEAARWWTQTRTPTGFQRFMCWVALDEDDNLIFAWDVNGKAYAARDYQMILAKGKQLPPP